MQFISTRTHGMVDYGTALALIILPFLFMGGGAVEPGAEAVGAATGGGDVAAWVLIVAGLLLLGLSLLTRYELGALKKIPMPTHLATDGALGAVLIVSPWLFGFADVIWWPHVLVGLAEIGLALTTERRSSLEAPAGGATAQR